MTTASYRTTPTNLPSAVYDVAGTPTPEVAPTVSSGTGSPEAVVTAPVGSIYLDTAGPTLYSKATGVGNTGWSVAIAVSPIALTSLAAQATHTLVGNATGGSAVPTALSVAAVKTLLAYITTDIAGPQNYSGSGTPEAAVTAVVGSLYSDVSTPSVPVLYIKTSGSGNTGWILYT